MLSEQAKYRLVVEPKVVSLSNMPHRLCRFRTRGQYRIVRGTSANLRLLANESSFDHLCTSIGDCYHGRHCVVRRMQSYAMNIPYHRPDSSAA